MYNKIFPINTVPILLALVVGLILWTSMAGAFSLFRDKLTREDSQGAVDVSATYLVPKETEAINKVSFKLTLNTHSVDLTGYDLGKISSIQFDEAEPVTGGVWDFTGSAHHFKGIMTFNYFVPDGTKRLRFVIKNLDDVKKRVFEWEFPLNKSTQQG